ncbi:MAG TPA: sensor domain-containing diguanylate cyclase [Syntrophales bacterium]|nr:sensor domain-containing diguanylate cyclase [Syntrophales bacterium]HPQ44877.1 sensor domain-containing diguanylate cyclase [Syntrophales bacterium]
MMRMLICTSHIAVPSGNQEVRMEITFKQPEGSIPMTRKPTYEDLEKRIRILEEELIASRHAEEELRKRGEKYRFLTEQMTDTIWTLDMNMKPTYVSPSSMDVLGFSPEERVNQHLSEMVTQETYLRIIDVLAREMEREKEENVDPDRTVSIEMEYYHKDGHTVWLENKVRALRDVAGTIIGIHGVSRDISDRKRAEEALRKSEESYRLLFESAGEGIMIFQGKEICLANPALIKILGYPEDTITVRPFFSFVHPDDRDVVIDRYSRRIKGESVDSNYSFRIVTEEGTEKWLEIHSQVISWDEVPATLNFISDITDRKRAEDSLRESEIRYRELSIVDDLTQLYNSRHFFDQLMIEINRSNRYKQPLTLLLLDLDDFKTFNDTYGHIEGNRVLSSLGQVIKNQLREVDSAYRYGGEEFTVLLPMTTGENGVVSAERIRSAFKKENFSPVASERVYMTMSMGVTQYEPGEEMKTFVNRVDRFMYRAKGSGKDRICFA